MTGHHSWFRISFHFIKFIITIFLAIMIYQVLFATIFTKQLHFFFYIFFWLFSAYVVLPWLNRQLTRLYVPNYFIGRTQTSDGLLGDPINLAFNGKKKDIIEAFQQAGWHQAEPLNLTSSIKMATSSILGDSYPTAPVSPLFLFHRQQTLAFEREINNNPRKRHHIRLWKTPTDWHLPGGKQVGWLAAATYDRNIGLSLFTGQITHKIAENTDQERDFVIETLKKGHYLSGIETIEHFTSSYHSRNGGGDRIETDGALPFIDIKRETLQLVKTTPKHLPPFA